MILVPCTQIIVTSLFIILFKVTIFDITKHDETEFSDEVVKSIIRGWAHGENKDDLANCSNIIPQRKRMCHYQDTHSFLLLRH